MKITFIELRHQLKKAVLAKPAGKMFLIKRPQIIYERKYLGSTPFFKHLIIRSTLPGGADVGFGESEDYWVV